MKRLIAPLLFLAHLVLTVAIWMHTSGAGWNGGVALRSIAIGNLAGLLAVTLVLWELLLMSRIPWIEQPWGHDRLSIAHHILGLSVVIILVMHPLFLALGYGVLAQVSPVTQFVSFVTSFENILPAFIAFLLFITIVIVSIEAARRRFRYEVWYVIHLALYAAVLLSFGHQLEIGRDLFSGWQTVAWQGAFWGVLVIVAWCRFITPLVRFQRHRFRVIEVTRETQNVVSIVIGGRRLERFPIRAGQFMIVRFLIRGLWWEAHPFSLSEAPDGNRLRITVKALGDFSGTLGNLRVGTPVLVEGPLGRFIAARAKRPGVLLIAGGIGITPVRALFEEFAHAGRRVDLVYSARTEEEMALRDELNALTGPRARVHVVPSETRGHISAEMLRSLVPDITDRDVYVCGPRAMMDDVSRHLVMLGVSQRHIFSERFALG